MQITPRSFGEVLTDGIRHAGEGVAEPGRPVARRLHPPGSLDPAHVSGDRSQRVPRALSFNDPDVLEAMTREEFLELAAPFAQCGP